VPGGIFLHVVLVYPFLDLRFLISAVPQPRWTRGGYKTVGSFGAVIRDDFSGDEAEIRADAAIAFGVEYEKRRLAGITDHDDKSSAPPKGKKRAFRQRARSAVALDSGFSVVQRRLLADGDGHVRLELILRDNTGSTEPLVDRLEAILTTRAYVVREGPVDLINAGFRVARLYLTQSAKTAEQPAEPIMTQLLREGAGSPFIVVMYQHPPANGADGTPLEVKPDMFAAVTCQLMKLAGRSTGVWQIWGAGGLTDWLGQMRMLCRIICQLSEVTSLTRLQQDRVALAPDLIDQTAVDQFYRVRTGQLSRSKQGVWSVPAVQPVAAQHLKVAIDEAIGSKEALATIMRRDKAGALAQTLGQILRKTVEKPMLIEADRQRIAALLARLAAADKTHFWKLLDRAALAGPKPKLDWTGDPDADANLLIDWALVSGVSEDASRTALASLLIAELDGLDADDATAVAATLLAYRMVRDEVQRAELQRRYQIPLPAGDGEATGSIGPDFAWHGPEDEVELQSFFASEPPEYLDVSYLIEAVRNARSVCLVDVVAANEFGTGVLIHERFVLTNYHVIQNVMVDGRAGPDAKTIQCAFGGYSDGAKRFQIALDGNDPIPASSPPDKHDFALLRLASRIGEAENALVATPSLAPPSRRAALHILQHPGGGSMKLGRSHNAVTYIDAQTGVIQYVTRTSKGSSGAPCFDDKWQLVAIHHAERPKGLGTIREGILIGAIHEQVRDLLRN
jgi:hypothetical protein